MNNAVITFVRNPEIGKVKTRLAASVGDESALQIYKFLLEHTRKQLDGVAADKFIFYHEEITDNDLWTGKNFHKKVQVNADLGTKMRKAFKAIFGLDYDKVIIIGSDCYQLSTEIIEQAITALEGSDVVIGPAKDGGFYLLGMKTMQEDLFSLKEYSTDHVCTDTLAICKEKNLSVSQLITLSDVDEAEDVNFVWK